jgi:hypothetical protein
MAPSMSNTGGTGANETCETSSKDIEPVETYKNSNRRNENVSQKNDSWDLRRALASSELREDFNIEHFTNKKHDKHVKKHTKNAHNFERGPKARSIHVLKPITS